jgi:DNA-binding PadR family transcriptional regulator
MRNKTLRILEFLETTTANTNDIVSLFFTDYVTSYRIARGIPLRRQRPKYKEVDILTQEKHRLYDLLYRLKKDGLITKNKKGLWTDTKKGKKRRKSILSRSLAPHPTSYTAEKTAGWKIVTFDIPEREKKKRNWLRAVLRNLGFTMLQKSVWIGKIKFPESFIHDLHKHRLLQYIEILEATKTGSLSRFKT